MTTPLEPVPNPRPERDYRIQIRAPEFTCLCPRTGQPDFATIEIDYVPDATIVELKSLKLYLQSYRNRGTFHEAVTNQILDDLVASLAPRRMEVRGIFGVRGGISTTVVAEYERATMRGSAHTGRRGAPFVSGPNAGRSAERLDDQVSDL